MTERIELKPCPFCAGPMQYRVFAVNAKDEPVDTGIECEECNLNVHAWEEECELDVIDRVNRRAPDLRAIDEAIDTAMSWYSEELFPAAGKTFEGQGAAFARTLLQRVRKDIHKKLTDNGA